MTYLTQQCSFEISAGYLQPIFTKILTFLDKTDNSRNSDYKVKIEICRFLKTVGLIINKKLRQFLGINLEFIIKKLEDLSRDRVLKVQTNAKQALKVWKRLEDNLMRLDRRKLQQSSGNNKSRMSEGQEKALLDKHFGPGAKLSDLDSLDVSLEEIDGVEDLDSNGEPYDSDPSSRNNQNSIQRGIDAYRKNNIISKTFLKQTAHNYQKKRTGTGGGFIKKIDNYSKLHAKKSYNTIREKLRQQVLQDKIDFQKMGKYKKRGKWQFLDEEQEDKRKSRISSPSKSRNSKLSRVEKLRSMTHSQKESQLNKESKHQSQPEEDDQEDSVEKMSLKSLSKKFNSIQVDYDEADQDGEDEQVEDRFEQEEIRGDRSNPNAHQKSKKPSLKSSNNNSVAKQGSNMSTIAKMKMKSPTFRKDRQTDDKKYVSFDQPKENTATFGEIEETAVYTDSQELEPTTSQVIQVSDTYKVSTSGPNTNREKYNPGMESTVAYEESHTLASTVDYPPTQNPPSTGRYGPSNPEKDYAEDYQLEETVKYPDEEDDNVNYQQQMANNSGEGSLDPTVYYGSTDEEDRDMDEIDETQQYVPTQQSIAPTENFAQKVHFEDHSQASHYQAQGQQQKFFDSQHEQVQIPFNSIIARNQNSMSQSYSQNQPEEPIYDHLSQSYLRALELLSVDDYNAAYRIILQNQDDFYLLRLMTKTGVCWERLDIDLQRQLKERIADIFQSDFLTDLRSQWTASAQDQFQGFDGQSTSNFGTESDLKNLIGRYNRRANHNENGRV